MKEDKEEEGSDRIRTRVTDEEKTKERQIQSLTRCQWYTPRVSHSMAPMAPNEGGEAEEKTKE